MARETRFTLGWLGIRPAWIILLVGIAVYTVALSHASIQRVANFETGVTDLGHLDNHMWRMSQGRWINTYNTTVMYNGAGHTSLILYALAPLYWMGFGLKGALAVQSLILALGSVPLYLLAVRLLRREGPALVLALVYLTYAPLHFANLDDFHPEVFGTTAMLFAAYFMEQRRERLTLVMAGLSLMCKETYAFSLIGLSLLSLTRREFRLAGALVGLALLWWFPIQSAVSGAHYGTAGKPNWGSAYTGDMGDTAGQVLVYVLRRPWHLWARFAEPQSLLYMAQLLAPVAALCLLCPRWLLPALPALAFNVLSEWLPTRMIVFRYTAPITPFIWLATVQAAGRVARWSLRRSAGPGEAASAPRRVGAVSCWVVPTLVLVVAGVVHLGRPAAYNERQLSRAANAAHSEAMKRAVALVPDDASVSAQYYFVPHLSTRDRVYWFPMPFWRYQVENPEYMYQLAPLDAALVRERLRQEQVQYVLVDGRGFPDTSQLRAPYDAPMSGEALRQAVELVRTSDLYDEVFAEDGVAVFRLRAS